MQLCQVNMSTVMVTITTLGHHNMTVSHPSPHYRVYNPFHHQRIHQDMAHTQILFQIGQCTVFLGSMDWGHRDLYKGHIVLMY